MAQPDLRTPKAGHLPFVCPTCGSFCAGHEAVYDPRRSKRSRKVICRPCALWLLDLRPAWDREPGGKVAWAQLAFPTLSSETTDETDSPADSAKAG